MDLLDIFGTIMGIGLCIAGVLAIKRGTAIYSPEGEDDSTVTGTSAHLLGVAWLLFGILIFVSFLGPHLSCGPCSNLRDFFRSYFTP